MSVVNCAVDLAAEQIVNPRRAAFVGHVDPFDFGHLREEFAREMAQSALPDKPYVSVRGFERASSTNS